MSIAKVTSSAIVGLDAVPIDVEVDIGQGLPNFLIVGLPDKAVEESRERVRSALKNSGMQFPISRITANLAPADIRKEGPSYDLPIATAILLAQKQVLPEKFHDTIIIGELSLDGRVRHVNGVLPIVMKARESGFRQIILPREDLSEALLIGNIDIIPIETLKDLILFAKNEKQIKPRRGNPRIENENMPFEFDFAYIKGQEHSKRSLEIAAAGNHNVIFAGPPGSGKTLLIRAMPSILPSMDLDEALEVTKLYSIAGLLSKESPFMTKKPFRAPHHTASHIALVGGGQSPRPGEITLAHRGILFLDELPEFPRQVLEVLRQPLEDGLVTISRATGSMTFPAKFLFVAAQNPCPCGYHNDPVKPCICSPAQIIQYKKKISGPLLDRIDLHVEVPKVEIEKLTGKEVGESSNVIKARVENARKIQRDRFSKKKIKSNSEMTSKEVEDFCELDKEAFLILKSALNQMNLSARAYHRILKLSRTIADLASSEKILPQYVAEALQFRPKNEELF